MYLDYLVDVPEVKGKITFRSKGNARYVYYEYDRIYDPDKKYTTVKRVTIGKVSADDELKMRPNENFKKYFLEVETPEELLDTGRSSYLNEGRCIYGHKQDSKRYGIRQETGRNTGS
jgi:hypothetical protein